MIRVRHFGRVLQPWLTFQAAGNRLPEGEMILAVAGERLCLTVGAGNAQVASTARPPQLSLTREEAVRLFFHPAGLPVHDPVLDALCKAWFPLPLAFLNGDEF